MKKRVFLCLIGIIVNSCFALNMWEVRSGEATVYLFGSVHALKDDIYPLPQEIENAFNSSNFLCVEADVKKPIDKNMIMEKALYKNGEKSILTPQMEIILAKGLENTGLSVKSMERFKPWFISLNYMSIKMLQYGFDPQKGVDMYFMNKAGAKNILELEGVQKQIELFSALPDSLQLAYLKDTIENQSQQFAEIDSLTRAYLQGNETALESLLLPEIAKPQFTDLYEVLIFRRNSEMTKKIETWLKTPGTYFVVVGAAHLMTSRGIPALLRHDGYETNLRSFVK